MVIFISKNFNLCYGHGQWRGVTPPTANVIELAYVNGVVWQEHSQKLWWAWESGSFMDALWWHIIQSSAHYHYHYNYHAGSHYHHYHTLRLFLHNLPTVPSLWALMDTSLTVLAPMNGHS